MSLCRIVCTIYSSVDFNSYSKRMADRLWILPKLWDLFINRPIYEFDNMTLMSFETQYTIMKSIKLYIIISSQLSTN